MSSQSHARVASIVVDDVSSSASIDGPRTRTRTVPRTVAPRLATLHAVEPLEPSLPIDLDLWDGLLGGEWIVVDRDERDDEGVFLLARASDERRVRALTDRERQVVTLTAQGHSMKFVALDLVMGESTAATLLRRAIAKMGVQSRMELVRLFAVASQARCA